MVFVGKHETILADTVNNVDVRPFTPDYQAMENVSILEVTVQYTYKYMGKAYVLIYRNSLSVTST